MTIRSAAPLIAVRNVPSSVAFYGKFGLAPVVEWSTYARLSDGAGAVLHIGAAGDAPSDRPAVARTAPQPRRTVSRRSSSSRSPTAGGSAQLYARWAWICSPNRRHLPEAVRSAPSSGTPTVT